MSVPIVITKGKPTETEVAALAAVFTVFSAHDAARNSGAKDYWLIQHEIMLRSPYGITARDTRSNFSLAF